MPSRRCTRSRLGPEATVPSECTMGADGGNVGGAGGTGGAGGDRGGTGGGGGHDLQRGSAGGGMSGWGHRHGGRQQAAARAIRTQGMGGHTSPASTARARRACVCAQPVVQARTGGLRVFVAQRVCCTALACDIVARAAKHAGGCALAPTGTVEAAVGPWACVYRTARRKLWSMSQVQGQR
jgi:hypothetical protein